ncbi:MAG: sulfotransferase [Pseudomonadota bacterium]
MPTARRIIGKLTGLDAPRPRPEGHVMRRFVVLGLPRSGSTYLMTLLDRHRDLSCEGEQFNAKGIFHGLNPDKSYKAVIARDSAPVEHFKGIYEEAAQTGVWAGGFKFMIGHNISVLKALAEDPELHIIHIWRENRLAQVASLLKALETSRWAQIKRDDDTGYKINARPRVVARQWHELETLDFLISQWLGQLSNPILTLEYRELMRADLPKRLCDFLGVAPDPLMDSPLVKQGANRVLDRFENAGQIEHYFTEIGRAGWLGEEI